MKNFIALYLMFVAVSLTAQSKYFEKVIEWHYFTSAYSIVQKSNNNFVITGSTSLDNTLWASSYLLEVDNSGVLVAYDTYLTNQYESAAFDITSCNDGFMMVGYANVGTNNSNSFFIKVDSSGTFIDSTFVGRAPYTNNPNTICSTRDGGFLLGGEIQPYAPPNGQPTHPYLIKLDAAGNKLWDTIYYQYGAPYYAWVRDIKLCPTGGYYLLMADKYNYYDGNSVIAKIDEDGVILNQETIDYGLEENTGAMAVMSNGDIILTGSIVNNASTPTQRTGLVIRLNSNFGEIWRKTSEFKGVSACGNIAQTPDGGYLATGCNIANGNVGVEVVKYNVGGGVKWVRHYGSATQDDYIFDMIPTADGGYISCGRAVRTPAGYFPYLLKVNCMGLLTEPQANFTTQIDTAALLVTLQNASQYTYPDSLDGGHYLWDFGDGTPPLQTQNTTDTLLHTYPQYGTYAVTLKAIVCTDTSTLQQTLTVGYPPPPPTIEGIWLSPNPATNQLFINSQEPLQANLVLYNALGQKVGTTALSGNSTQINVANLPSGIYLYQIINPQNQTLQYGKVSILH